MILLGAVVPHPPILLPQIGRGREEATAATLNAYQQIAAALRAAQIDRAVLISSHGIVTLGRFHLLNVPLNGDFSSFGAPDVHFQRGCDQELITAIARRADEAGIPCSTVGEWEPADHASGVPVTLLDDSLPPDLAVISMSFRPPQDHFRFGQSVGTACRDLGGRTAVIASGDGAHTLSEDGPYGFHPRAAVFQAACEDALQRWDAAAMRDLDEPLRAAVDESVVSPALILMGAFDGVESTSEILSSEAPWGVAYTTALIRPNAPGVDA